MKSFWLIILLSCYFFILGNGILSFTSLDEGRNASAVINMIKNKDFLIPYYNCQPRFEKPPMLYWIALVFFELFGKSEFSARLVSGLSALGVAVFTYILVKRHLDEQMAYKSTLVLLTLPHMWIESRAFVPEMLNTFFMMVSLYLFLLEKFLLGWFFLAFTFLTKGPVGVVLTLLVYLLWKRNLKVFSLKGIVLFLILGGSWYFYMLYRFGEFYFFRFFLYENFMRYTGQRLTHPSPFYYYFIVIIFTTIFYIPVYPKVIKHLKNDLLPYIFWFFSVLLFFSFAKNKLHHYILFAYPPLSVLIANSLELKYIKRVLLLCVFFVFALFFVAGYYQDMRFVPKAYTIIKHYPGSVYFYKSEDSSLVFYSQRCISVLEDPSKPFSGLVITKYEHTKEFPTCRLILKGVEFDGVYALLSCP
jgi:4-amino-4-deoxy-L-arabinose transferase-like glycosyltransferase